MITELRCTAPHPTIPRWTCCALLGTAVGATVALDLRSQPMPGEFALRCPRCGSDWVVRRVTIQQKVGT